MYVRGDVDHESFGNERVNLQNTYTHTHTHTCPGRYVCGHTQRGNTRLRSGGCIYLSSPVLVRETAESTSWPDLVETSFGRKLKALL